MQHTQKLWQKRNFCQHFPGMWILFSGLVVIKAERQTLPSTDWLHGSAPSHSLVSALLIMASPFSTCCFPWMNGVWAASLIFTGDVLGHRRACVRNVSSPHHTHASPVELTVACNPLQALCWITLEGERLPYPFIPHLSGQDQKSGLSPLQQLTSHLDQTREMHSEQCFKC